MKLSDILNVISDDLQQVEISIEREIQSDIPLVTEISGYLLGSGGKRLRPSVLLLASGACGLLDGKNRIAAATALELIHTATLLHDDVVDEATLRRGKPAANVVWGNKPTVLVGDFMLAKALSLLQSCGNLELIKAVTDASAKLAEGQVLEVMSGREMIEISEDLCFSIIDHKTASLIESCGKVGALLANTDNGASVNALSGYGQNIGIAFQLIDDALDYTSSESEFGKQVGHDLLEGKMTLPLYYSLEKAPDSVRKSTYSILKKGNFTEAEIEQVKEIVDRYNGVKLTHNAATEYVYKAKDCIKVIPENVYKNSLNRLADYVVDRTF